MEKNRGGFGENTHELEKNAKMLEKINTIMRFRPRPFGYASAAGMSPATAAVALAKSGVSAYTVQEDVHFLSAVIALMSRPSPDHANTGLQAKSQNLIAHSGKQDQQDRINRVGEPSPSLLAAPRLNNESSSRPILS